MFKKVIGHPLSNKKTLGLIKVHVYQIGQPKEDLKVNSGL